MPKTTTPCRISIMFTTKNISENDTRVPRFGAKVAKTPPVEGLGIQKEGITERWDANEEWKLPTSFAGCAAM